MTLPETSPLWLIVLFMVANFLWKEIIKPFKNDPDKYFDLIDKIRGRAKSKDPVADQAYKDRHIANEVDVLRRAIGASRAMVWGFHNGEAWIGNNESKKKMSLKKELVDFDPNGLPRVPILSLKYKEEYSNIPISQVSWWIDETVNNRLRFPDTSLCPDLITRDWYLRSDIKSVLCVAVKNKDLNTTLIISYEWIGEPVDESKWTVPEGVDLSTSDKLMAYFVAQHDRLRVYL
jgi:hypothetical protein